MLNDPTTVKWLELPSGKQREWFEETIDDTS
jgi:hypothetical protein